MRITVNLPDELIREAKKYALEANTSLAEIIGDALREALAKPRRKKLQKEFKLITYGEVEWAPAWTWATHLRCSI